MQQAFGTDNHYIQDDGRGHEIIFVPINSGENTADWVSLQLQVESFQVNEYKDFCVLRVVRESFTEAKH